MATINLWCHQILQISFGWLGDTPPIQEFKKSYKSELEKIEGFEFPEDFAAHYYNFPAERWCKVVDKLRAAIQRIVPHDAVQA